MALHHIPQSSRNPLRARLVLAATVALVLLAVPAGAQAANVKVMTRNLYLGADLTEGVNSTTVQGLVNAAGRVVKQVDQNKFGVRSKGLAAEILSKKPDLVGMQEVSLWRTQPCTKSAFPPSAAHVRYDYLTRLLKRLNDGQPRYHLVIAEPEFDFEIQANTDENEDTHAPGCSFGSELNIRLTMRDAIIARNGTVTTTNARRGHFDTLLRVTPVGFNVDVTRGWTAVDAKVPGAAKFRFVNTHLEAFDSLASNHTNKGTDVGKGEVRQAQAKELTKAGGPAAAAPLKVVLLGDLNSDTQTAKNAGDKLANKALTAKGFVERSARSPFSCCINAAILTTTGGGKVSDFDHNVDHVMTNAPNKIKLVNSSVLGRQPVNGFWSSDHAGLFSTLSLP